MESVAAMTHSRNRRVLNGRMRQSKPGEEGVLYTVWYNFVRTNCAVRMPPAMAAGIAKSPMEMADIVGLIDAAAPKPGPRGP